LTKEGFVEADRVVGAFGESLLYIECGGLLLTIATKDEADRAVRQAVHLAERAFAGTNSGTNLSASEDNSEQLGTPEDARDELGPNQRRLVVVQAVAGSSPVAHPSFELHIGSAHADRGG
jgi:hypothetical protein